jgi:uncharacterized membrane protein
MWVALLVATLGGAVIATVGFLGATERLPRNSLVGIRIPSTMRSDEAWRRAHRAAGPLFVFGGVGIFAVGAAFFPFAAAGRVDDVIALGVLIAMLIVTLSLVLGATVLARTAAATASDSGA